MSLARFAVRRPVTMSMISISIVLLGIVALSRLPVDLMPDVTFPSLTVTVEYEDVGPLEMEELVTRPLEQAVAAIAGLEEVVSTSQEGTSQVRLNFDWGTDLNEAAADLRSRLDRIRGRLPEDAEPPVVFKFDAANAPIMFLGLESDFAPVALREMAENDLSPRLERVPGVAAVTVRGGLRRQIRVELAKDKITALDLALNEIIDLLDTENRNVPIGELDERQHDLPAAESGAVREPRRHPQRGGDDPRRGPGLHARHRGGDRRDGGPGGADPDQRADGRPDGGQQAVGGAIPWRWRGPSAPKSIASTRRCRGCGSSPGWIRPSSSSARSTRCATSCCGAPCWSWWCCSPSCATSARRSSSAPPFRSRS